MLPQPIPFLLHNGNKNITINSKVIEILSLSKRPYLIVIYGKHQTGKSSILNQFINGPGYEKYCNKSEPIKLEHIKETYFIGPFKLKELQEKMKIQSNIKDENENEIFFVEGSDNPSEKIGLLTLLQVSIVSIYVTKEIPSFSSMKNLLENIEYNFYIKQIFPSISNQEICRPILFIHIKDIPEKLVYYSKGMKKYLDDQAEAIHNSILSFDNNLLLAQFLSIITLPEYVPNDEVQTRKTELDLYWSELNRTFHEIITVINKKNPINGKTLCEMINYLFPIFNNLNDSNDIQQIISITKTKFDEIATQIINEYMKNLKSDINKCNKFISDDAFAEEQINECIKKNQNDIYLKLVPNLVNDYMLRKIINLQDEIREFLHQENVKNENEIIKYAKDQKIRINEEDIKSTETLSKILLSASKNGHLEMVKLLLGIKGIDVNAKNADYRDTALMNASINGHTDIVKLLLEQKEIDINAKNNDGNTAFMIATLKGNIEVVKLFLEQKETDINAKNKYGDTALIFATINGHIELVEILLGVKEIDINAKNDFGKTALMFAAENANADLVKLLLQQEKISLNVKEKNGKTALILASENGIVEIVKLLLEHDKINSNIKDFSGQTALMHACEKGYIEVVKLLVQHEGNDINVTDNDGNTALAYAAKNDQKEIAEVLKQNGIKSNCNIL